MSRAQQIIDAINANETSMAGAIYFQKGFTFTPLIFSPDYNETTDWCVSRNEDPFIGIFTSYRIDVRHNGETYRLKLTKEEKKAIANAYNAWYIRQRDYYREEARRAAQ
jgi:hypothetical protein